ncbi:hypothetical protein [Candidatus Vidania fulgoroideorum]
MKTISRYTVKSYISGIVLKPYEVKKYKSLGFCISSFYLKRVSSNRSIMLFNNSDLSYSRTILLNRKELIEINSLLKVKSNRFNINYILITNGIVKLSFTIVSLQVKQLLLKCVI